MSPTSGHSQRPTLIVAATAAGALLLLYVTRPDRQPWISALTLSAITAMTVLFGTPPVEVQEGKTRCWFGPGLVHWEFPLAEAMAGYAVRNLCIYGSGIRWTPHGQLLNVSGLDAMGITLSSVRRFRIGTDQRDELKADIRRGARLSSEGEGRGMLREPGPDAGTPRPQHAMFPGRHQSRRTSTIAGQGTPSLGQWAARGQAPDAATSGRDGSE